MRNKIFIILVVLIAAAGALFFWQRSRGAKQDTQQTKEILPFMGTIQNTVSTTATVLPKNRLEIKPPVNGRIEQILVKEGQIVSVGQTLAWMSSTERAALLDAARGKGEKDLAYWEDAYKAIPLISPIAAEVIVAKTQPGQTVTTADAVIVLSDQLIVRAQVDETDIGKIQIGQSATVTIDAYPDEPIPAEAEHIYYESKTVNNVTIYEVDLAIAKIPEFFRSGMNASVDVLVMSKKNILLIPQEAVLRDGEEAFVLLKKDDAPEPQKQAVSLGLSDDKNYEVISGINEGDTILVKSLKYALPQSSTGTNPFMPARRSNASSRSTR